MVLKAKRLELHGRIVAGSASSNPVIEVVVRTTAATAPDFHPLTVRPFDAEIAATLRGLADFSPKPWPERFREMQARNGSIEITHSRVQQGDLIAVSAGTLSLTPRGGLDGQLQITVVGIEPLLKTLDLDQIMSQGKVGQAVGALDRLMPGLSKLARQNARPGHSRRSRRDWAKHDAGRQAGGHAAAPLFRWSRDAGPDPGWPRTPLF